MELKDFTAITSQIAQNLSNQALVTELLTKLNDDYTQETTSKTSLMEQSSQSAEQIKQLQQTNMNLFLRVGNPVADKALQSEKPLSYEDLLTTEFGVKE
jgi:hypothetical protein